MGLGATWIERHITLDKNNWGSDQFASLNPEEFFELLKNIRMLEKSIQYPEGERKIFKGELIKKKSLRTTS